MQARWYEITTIYRGVPGVPRLAFSEEVFIIELMATITIPKKEYQELVDKKFRYEMLREIMKEDIFAPPPTRNRENILALFRATRRYNKKFLEGLKKGLRRSPYFR